MCLFSKFPAQIAKEDIKCYKILEITKKGNYKTAFTRKKVKLNSLKIGYPRNTIVEYITPTDPMPITTGFIHTYNNIILATEQCNFLNNFTKGTYTIVEAIIPKGTEYFIGWSSPNMVRGQYASRKLFITNKIVYDEYNRPS